MIQGLCLTEIDSTATCAHASPMQHVHATCVEIAGSAVLLCGPSGAGKSDLALRLVDGGARLVSDDQTLLLVAEGRLVASAPQAIAGLLEVRGMGIIRMPHHDHVPVALAVELVDAHLVERLPEPQHTEFLGISVPLLRLWPFEASCPAKVRLAMASATRDIMQP